MLLPNVLARLCRCQNPHPLPTRHAPPSTKQSLSFGNATGAHRAMAVLRTHGLTIFLNNTLMVAGLSVLLAMVFVVLWVAGLMVLFLSRSPWVLLVLGAFASAVVSAMMITFELVTNAFKAVFVFFVQVTAPTVGGLRPCSLSRLGTLGYGASGCGPA